MRRWTWVVLVAALAACTGSRSIVPEQADPTLTGDEDLAEVGSGRSGGSGDDGMGFLDDVMPGDDEGDDSQSDAATGQPDPFADLFGGAAGGAAPNPFADLFAPQNGSDPAANPFADLLEQFLGGAGNTGGQNGGQNGGNDGGDDAGDGSSDSGETTDPNAAAFEQLLAFLLELLAAFLGGGAA